MTVNSKNTASADTKSNSRKLARGFTRRRIMLGGAGIAGVAATVLTGRAQANTQQPVAPEMGRVNPNGRFANKVVLITGATSGIGEATARAFAHEGAIVHFCGRREALVKQIGQAHGASPAQVALAWILTKPFISSIIIGANKMQQLEDNLGAAQLKLSAQEVEKLDILTAPQSLYPGWMQAMGWDSKVKAALDPESSFGDVLLHQPHLSDF